MCRTIFPHREQAQNKTVTSETPGLNLGSAVPWHKLRTRIKMIAMSRRKLRRPDTQESMPWYDCRWTVQTYRLFLLPDGELRKVWISPVLGKDEGSGLSCFTPSAVHNSA